MAGSWLNLSWEGRRGEAFRCGQRFESSPHINAPKEYQEETKEKETDHKIVDDEEETKFETILEPEEERDSKRSVPPYEEEDEDEEPDLAEEARVEIIILPSESKPAPWFSQTVKRKA